MGLIERRRVLAVAGAATLASLPGTRAFAQADKTAAEKALAESGPLPENVFGSASAPVTVVEYASLTCHRCRDFHIQTWPQVKAKYVDTGRIQFVFREFPLNALDTGGFMLARCAGEKRWSQIVDCSTAPTTRGRMRPTRSRAFEAS
nr:DsbA family protein [Chenggangzhangella methanolivorans]